MNKPIKVEGILTKRSDGRYEIKGTDFYFTSGQPIEVWNDEWQEYQLTRIEYKDGDYYAVYVGHPLEGLKVRCR